MIWRGVNPRDVYLYDALKYATYRDDLIQEQQNIWKEAASELFGEQ